MHWCYVSIQLEGGRWLPTTGPLILDTCETFAKVHHNRLSISVLLSDRTLEARDVAILYCLAEMMNPANGKVLISTSALARKINMRQPVVAHAIKRLKAARVVVNRRDRDGGYWYFRLNPRFVSVGNERQRTMHWRDFAAAIQEDLPTMEEMAAA
jgi:DNA-binding transcriptional ArsR family regulator